MQRKKEAKKEATKKRRKRKKKAKRKKWYRLGYSRRRGGSSEGHPAPFITCGGPFFFWPAAGPAPGEGPSSLHAREYG